MKKTAIIKDKLITFNKIIKVQGDKSLSIRWALIASQAIGISRAYNLLESEDVKNTLKVLNKLGIKIKNKNNYYEIFGNGLNSFNYKNNTIINAQNSGTLARLILGVLARSENYIILKGDKSLSNRDFSRVIKPLNHFGVKIKSNNNKLPLKMNGNKFLKPIYYEENKGSAQVKSCIMLAALNSPGITKIKCIPSRDHTERMFKYIKIPIIKTKKKKFDIIKITGQKQYKSFNYRIPGDISSSAFFIALTLLSKDSKILIKNVNINKSRTGIIDIFNKMNAKIKFKNKKIYQSEEVADIYVKSSSKLKAINCPTSFNSRSIDEFLLIFLVAAKANGISYFKKIEELRHKESDRLKFTSKFLKMIGIKSIETKNSLKIYGNPNLSLNGKYEVKNFQKDHRVCMLSFVAALTLGGKWKINDIDSINTSFPKFIDTIKKIGAIVN